MLGLIGGIGSGKSRVAAALAERGAHVIAADVLGHDALRQPENRARLVERWGPGILNEAGEIDRKRVAAIVFASADERRALEAVSFPYIEQRIHAALAQAQQDDNIRIIVLDAAIMLEAGWGKVCDYILFVEVPREVRLQRLQAGRGWSESEVNRRELAQWPVTEKRQYADFVLDNAGDAAHLESQLDLLLRALTADAAARPNDELLAKKRASSA